MRYIIVGDVHGQHAQLRSILHQAKYVPGEDRLIFTGDYADHYWETPVVMKGVSNKATRRHVKKTIYLLLDLQEQAPDTVHFLIGNHDVWFRDWVNQGGLPKGVWWDQGGYASIASYVPKDLQRQLLRYDADDVHRNEHKMHDILKKYIPDGHKRFYRTLEQYYLDDRVVVVHGGFPDDLVDQQFIFPVMKQGARLRVGPLDDIIWDRDFWEAGPRQRKQFKEAFGDRWLVVGHTFEAVRGSQKVSGPFINSHAFCLMGDMDWDRVDLKDKDCPVRGHGEKFVNIDSVGLHALVIYEDDTFEIVGGGGSTVKHMPEWWNLVDTHALGACGLSPVQVRCLSPVPI